jgi:hypothetical protein
MKPSAISKDQATKIAKAALYVGVSAILDYLISQTTDTQFGVLTPVINILLVTVKQVFTQAGK